MAAMTTALTVFSDKENARTYTSTGSTTLKPKRVLQKRTVPNANQEIVEDVVTTLHGAEDSLGAMLDSKVSITTTIRRSKYAIKADVDAALVVHQDIIGSDEFQAVADNQTYIS